MKTKRHLPLTHIGLTQRTWQWIHTGLERCRHNYTDRQTCLQWCQKFPEHTEVWIEILQDQHKDMTELAMITNNYADLPPDAMIWWERIIQNHPFAAIFAKERYAILLQKRRLKTPCG